MHGNLLALDGVCAICLNGHLAGWSSAQKGVCVNAPCVRVPVIGNRLDQVTVRGTHADPQRGITRAAAGCLGQDKSGSGLPYPGTRANGTGAEGRTHGSLNRGSSGEDGKGLAEGRHFDSVKE